MVVVAEVIADISIERKMGETVFQMIPPLKCFQRNWRTE